MLAMIVKVRIKPKQRERFLAGIEDDAICSERDEPGCLRFNVLQDRADENVYYFLEIYRDEAARAAHREAPHYARWMETRAATVESAERIETNTVIPRDPAYWEKTR